MPPGDGRGGSERAPNLIAPVEARRPGREPDKVRRIAGKADGSLWGERPAGSGSAFAGRRPEPG